MPVLKYYGDLWGFSVLTDDGSKLLCYQCFRKAIQQGQVKKTKRALGTEDTTREVLDLHEKNHVYTCDGCNTD